METKYKFTYLNNNGSSYGKKKLETTISKMALWNNFFAHKKLFTDNIIADNTFLYHDDVSC